MAITTNTGAKKIEGTENWRNIFDIHNDTVDAYDALAEQKDEETGIVVRGNKTTHADGAAAGQFVILRNSTITGCADGLYTAAKAIPYNTAIDSTYLTPVSGGGLNALNSKLKPQLLWQGTEPALNTDIPLLDNIQNYSEILVDCAISGGVEHFYVVCLVDVYNQDSNMQFTQSVTVYSGKGWYSNAISVKFSSNTSLKVIVKYKTGWDDVVVKAIWGKR